MEESYIRGVNQELIRTLKKLIEVTEKQKQAIIDKLTEVSTAITGKLDEVIANQQEISIIANTINLNTDTVEAKLDGVKASIEAMQTETVAELDAIGTSVDSILTKNTEMDGAIDGIATKLASVHTDMNSKLDTINSTTNIVANNTELINTTIVDVKDNKLGTPTTEGDTVISLLEDVKANTTPATV